MLERLLHCTRLISSLVQYRLSSQKHIPSDTFAVHDVSVGAVKVGTILYIPSVGFG